MSKIVIYRLCMIFSLTSIFILIPFHSELSGISLETETKETNLTINNISSSEKPLTPDMLKQKLQEYWEIILITFIIMIIFLLFIFYIIAINSKLKRAQKELFIHKENLEELIKKRTSELYESEEFLRTIFNAATNISFITTDIGGPDTKILSFSPGAEKIFGYSKDEIIGEKVAILHPEEIVNEFTSMQNRLRDGKKGFSGESQLIKKSGEIFPVFFSLNPLKDENGTLIGTLGISIDISEIKNMEQLILKNEEFLKETNKIAKIGGWELSIDTMEINCTNQIFKIFESSHKSPLTLDIFSNFISDEDRELFDTYINNAVKYGKPFEMELSGITSTNKNLVLKLVCNVQKENEKIVKINGIIQDISEQKEIENKHNQLKMQINQIQKMESVGRLAGGIAHDYNNMLSVIIGYADISLKVIDKNHDIYSNLCEISKAAKRSSHITRQLLAFARKQTINPKIININENIENMLKMLKRLLGENINLTWTPEEDTWPVLIDPGQLDQILATLCVYSKNKIDSNGDIHISTHNKIFDIEYCENNLEFSPGSYIVLSLKHNGKCINPKYIDYIFEPFIEKNKNEVPDLSLPTVYGIVKQNMGTIKVESKESFGTTFKIYLPRQKKFNSEIESADEHEVISKSKSKTVLLVEDEEAVLNLCKTMLKMKGFEVLATNVPAKALKIARDNPHIDILVTDVVMPDMNGKELSDKINEIIPEIKCLFISGYTSDVIGENGILDSETNFLEKPFVVQDLCKKIDDILRN